ncbi:hypothetical protein AYO20_09028 [Fonsecaea nubica]|uniref:Protein kinase domain-containing protein n=1 Tax=Fonsecaea nubica TaxID=856822 RepID=A0A178CLG7_9EURO|nr:hypothetical protein AYO20_09028 [Fonsecaea nubica]OAL29835.1 hypothetical protein AYO20_09028 [Fonsecaea nubica]
MNTTTTAPEPWPHVVYDSDPYAGLPMTGHGMTGYILQLDEERVVKVAKTYSLDAYVGTPDFDHMDYINEINRKTLENEIKIYQRLGHYEGILSCFQTSNYGIELAFAKQGNLEDYINSNPEPPESLKIEWILSIIDTLSYVHSRRVLVDDIALRNFLVADGQLKLADFGQSIILPISTDMDTVCDNDLTTRIEILHLGWVIYSIAVWHGTFSAELSLRDAGMDMALFVGVSSVAALARRTEAELIWTPVLLGAIYRETAAPQGAAGSASDVFNPTKKRLLSRAMHRSLRRSHVELNWPSAHPQSPVLALRLLYYVPVEERPALTHALFRAYWVEDLNITDKSVLLDVARRSGIRSASSLTEAAFDDKDAQEALRASTAEVIARGTCGVPAFWVEGEQWVDDQGKAHQGRLYWGQDRMHFVEAALLAVKRGCDYAQVPNLASLQPRCAPGFSVGQKRVEFWHDFSSPWAFLGWTQLDRLKRQFGPDVEIVMKPILVGALFREVGAPNLPMAAVSQAKRDIMHKDMGDWIRHWNSINQQRGSHDKPVEMHWPTQFPIRTPTALRCAIVDPNLTPLLFRACWERNVNVSDDKALAEYLATAGCNTDTLFKRASSPQVKEQLRANTQDAIDAGICGVPSYRVFDKTDQGWVNCAPESGVIWGQDELVVVEDLVAGWKEKESSAGEHDRLASRL